jgi:hypothetical protein
MWVIEMVFAEIDIWVLLQSCPGLASLLSRSFFGQSVLSDHYRSKVRPDISRHAMTDIFCPKLSTTQIASLLLNAPFSVDELLECCPEEQPIDVDWLAPEARA